MDADEYRRLIQAEIADAAPRSTDLATALAIAGDRAAALDARVEAARTVNDLALGSEEAIDLLLSILGDDGEPAPLRQVALDGIKVLRFSSTALKARQPDMTRALKAAMEAEDEQLRQAAIELLAADRDVDVQRRLIEGLRDESKAITSPLRSVELLGYDIKADSYDVLREVVETHDDPEVRREALRLLAADQNSEELIERVVRDKDEVAAVRATGSAALQAVAREHFEAVAQDIVTDEDDYDDIKAVMLSQLAFQPPGAPHSDAFVAVVTRARDELAEDRPLKQAAERFAERRDV